MKRPPDLPALTREAEVRARAWEVVCAVFDQWAGATMAPLDAVMGQLAPRWRTVGMVDVRPLEVENYLRRTLVPALARRGRDVRWRSAARGHRRDVARRRPPGSVDGSVVIPLP